MTLARLFRRALPSKRRWCSIDAASKPSSTTPHSSTRALDESMPSHLALKCEIASESCVPTVVYWARRRVCRLRDLVSSSSTKDTSLSFHESAVLAWLVFPVVPASSTMVEPYHSHRQTRFHPLYLSLPFAATAGCDQSIRPLDHRPHHRTVQTHWASTM